MKRKKITPQDKYAEWLSKTREDAHEFSDVYRIVSLVPDFEASARTRDIKVAARISCMGNLGFTAAHSVTITVPIDNPGTNAESGTSALLKLAQGPLRMRGPETIGRISFKIDALLVWKMREIGHVRMVEALNQANIRSRGGRHQNRKPAIATPSPTSGSQMLAPYGKSDDIVVDPHHLDTNHIETNLIGETLYFTAPQSLGDSATWSRDGRLIIHSMLPETVMTALKGGPVDRLIGHPALTGLVIYDYEFEDDDTIIDLEHCYTPLSQHVPEALIPRAHGIDGMPFKRNGYYERQD